MFFAIIFLDFTFRAYGASIDCIFMSFELLLVCFNVLHSVRKCSGVFWNVLERFCNFSFFRHFLTPRDHFFGCRVSFFYTRCCVSPCKTPFKLGKVVFYSVFIVQIIGETHLLTHMKTHLKTHQKSQKM